MLRKDTLTLTLPLKGEERAAIKMPIIVSKAKCIGCGACALICPAEAIDVSDSFIAVIDTDACTGCLLCLDACSNDALEEK